MGWFKDWLMQQSNDNPAEVQPSQPWQSPPQAPEDKPPKQDISEPVITLLEMLERDEWEVVHGYEDDQYTWTTTNTLNRDVVIILGTSGFYSNSCLKGMDWMTYEERAAVIKAVDSAHKRLKAIAHKTQRQQFAIKLGVQNEPEQSEGRMQ